MNTKSIAFIVAGLLITTASYCQRSETDDMYFSSKDRAKTMDAKPAAVNILPLAEDPQLASVLKAGSSVNPTDGYSTRGVNPEYATLSTPTPSHKGQKEDPYFILNYRTKVLNQNPGDRLRQ